MQMATIDEPEGKPLLDLDPRKMVPGIVLQPQEYEVSIAMIPAITVMNKQIKIFL